MSPRAFTGLGGSRVASRFELHDPAELGFTSVRYAATDEKGGRCRVQLIDPALVAAAPDAERVREAMETLGRANHGGLLRPFAAGIDAQLGCAYFVEPVPPGNALPSHLKDHGRLESRAAAALLSQLASALAEVHALGEAHHAVTADCVFVARENGRLVARLAAFGDGVAQPNSRAIELDTDAQLAPEIADGARGDARADVWALAAVLQQTVDASTYDQLAGLLAQCLHDDPERRPPDAAAFLRTLADPGARTDDGGVSLDATAEGDAAHGRFIGDYEVVSLLGEGGMGAVYEVRDKAGQAFALKVIRGEGKAARERRRFLREVRAATALTSEHVARVLASGVDARTGSPFMAMELLLRGQDIADVIKRVGALEPQVATRIAADACLGLAEAHARGLIHRDIKPPNLFLHEADGVVVTKVCDFGIVKETGLNQANTVLTRTGALIGSPSYMSPEQAQSSSVVDVRTDIWSLAATLYEMLAGAPPWDGAKNIGEVLALLLTRDVPPILGVAPWVPAQLADVVHRGLARDPEARYPSALALREALLPFAAASPLAISSVTGAIRAPTRSTEARSGATSTMLQPAATPSRRRLGFPAAIAMAAVIGLGFAAWRASRSESPVGSPTESVEASVATCSLGSCTAQNGGKPSRCRADGGCVALEAEQCRVLADATALEDPNTVWFGAMLPTGDTDESFAEFGRSSLRAIDLALRDFASVGGLPARDGVPARSLAVIACDDSQNPQATARHLVNAGVPAVIGFRSSKDVIQLAQLEFIPNDVLVVAALNSSALISGIPHPDAGPRLVFRTASTSEGTTDALAALIHAREVVPDGPQRLVLLRNEGPVGAALAEAVSTKVRIDGMPVAQVGPAFRELAHQSGGFKHLEKSLDEVLELQPNVILTQGFNDSLVETFLVPLEQRWTSRSSRPIYLTPNSLEGPGFQRWLAKNPTVSQRLLGITTRSNTPANLRFTSSYNAVFGERLPPSEAPGAPYDSLFLLAYATYATKLPNPRGSDLARAIGSLVPPGKATDVGVGQILATFAELDRGGSIDLQGAFSRMDFDLKTGESPADYAILCAQKTADGKSYEGVESGLVYDSAQKKLTGTFNCK